MRFAHFALAALSALVFINLTSCSDTPPPTPRGGWGLSFQDTGAECLISSHNAAVGSVSPNKTDKLMSDLEDGASVVCSVTGAGPFKVDAKASYKTSRLQIIINSIPADATEANPATGGVIFSSANTQGIVYGADANEPCVFYFQPGTSQAVSAGKIWVSFQCPKIVAGMSMCAVAQGYAYFENCIDTLEE